MGWDALLDFPSASMEFMVLCCWFSFFDIPLVGLDLLVFIIFPLF
jgi:hypothetical protein